MIEHVMLGTRKLQNTQIKALTGWLRLVGSFKLKLSFAEHSLFYRALLQKRPAILRSLLIETTPYATTHALT